jgi:hypothetical protein
MKRIVFRIFVLLLGFVVISGCLNNTLKSEMEHFEKGTFGFDKEFLTKYTDVIELTEGNRSILIVPQYQGRVMTSTCNGDEGFSFGWINYELIKSQEILPQFNPFGGEERIWIGPEGGQYSFYFANEDKFDFSNWQVPTVFDTEPFQVDSLSESSVSFNKVLNLTNYSQAEFSILLERTVRLIHPEEYLNARYNIQFNELLSVGYESVNTFTNTGSNEWNKDSGLPSIWLLGMFAPSPDVTVVIPILSGCETKMGPKVNDDYFGKIDKDRLKVINDVIFFKADGKSRGKIGVSPMRTNGYAGSYDAKKKSLTIVEFFPPQGNNTYVNSTWQPQDNPYEGDAINSYNDGPLEDGSQMGPFYELETSSPALALKPNESYSHLQRTYHFMGPESILNELSVAYLGATLQEIVEVFGKSDVREYK